MAISALLMIVPTLAHTQTLTAMWDPNPPSDAVTSYQFCIGTTSLSCNFQSATVAASETSYTFAPSPGVLYRVAVRSVNAAGPGPYSDEVTISIPGLTQPANQSSQVNVAISPLSLSASDPDGGTIHFTHSGLPFGLSLNQSTGIITGTPTSPGTSNVTIFVSDDSVTTSRSFVWTVTTGSGGSDTTAPALAITSHTAGQTVSSSSITLAGTATDNGVGGSGITSVTVNGTAATGGAATGSNTANWNHAVTLAAGANTFTIVATDGVGNVRTSSITINRTTADASAPTLSITSHTSGQTVSSPTITLSGTATDSGTGGSGIASVTVNGTAATGGAATGNNTANWSRAVTLAAGANTFTMVATDGAGNVRSASITINRTSADTTAPTLSITSHTSGQTVSSATITLAGTATDNGSGGSGIASVTVNGTATGATASASNTANWSLTITLAAGPNVVTVVATDGAFNPRTRPITITYSAPAVGSAISASRASPTTVSPGSAVTAAWNGMPSPGPRDWIGLYTPGAATASFTDWIYVSCSQTPGSAGAASGSCPFVVPSNVPLGTYQLRFLANDGFTVRATSNTFTVTAFTVTAPASTPLTASPATVTGGGSVTASWNGIAAPTATDWIGLYTPGSSNAAFITWVYVSCSMTPGGVSAAGSCPLTVPTTVAGTYQLRLFTNDGFGVLATSNAFTVQ